MPESDTNLLHMPTDSDNRGEAFYSDEIPDNMHSQIVPVSHKDAHQIQSVCHQISISGLQAFLPASPDG